MQAGEGMLTQVEGPDYGNELKRGAQEALEELRNPGWLKFRQLGAWVSRAGGEPRKIWVWLPLISLSVYLDSLYIGGSQPWLQSESPGGLLQHLIPDPLYQNLCRRDPGITSSQSPQVFPLDSQG